MPIKTIYDCYGNSIIIEMEEFTINQVNYVVLEKNHYRCYINSIYNYPYNKIKNSPYYGDYIDICLEKDNMFHVYYYESPLFNMIQKGVFSKLYQAKKYIEKSINENKECINWEIW